MVVYMNLLKSPKNYPCHRVARFGGSLATRAAVAGRGEKIFAPAPCIWFDIAPKKPSRTGPRS